ncbi:hypothetical protein J5X84_38615 [Streptosporangiaceae bacterium NEAU-GS5]|nr:hypothetical protein [Streptosporangiaceae bacterium NEAU-GS5]
MRVLRIAGLTALLSMQGAFMTPAAAVAAPKKVLVELREQGGFAGIDNRVIVYTSGCARVRHRAERAATVCLTAGEMRKLRGELKRLRLGRSQAEPPGADFIEYTLAYRGHHASRYMLPGTWQPVVRRLEKVLRKHGG